LTLSAQQEGKGMAFKRQSQAIAMDLRWAHYQSSEGAHIATYPGGAGTAPVYVSTPAEIRAKAHLELWHLLNEWAETDARGYESFVRALFSLEKDGLSPLKGWAAMVYEESGIRLVDPCAHCRECRKSKEV
jgi:hypothetical protein